MLRTAIAVISLFVGWPSLHAPAVHELPWVDDWRLRPYHPVNFAVIEAGPQLAPLALAIAWRESNFDPTKIHENLDKNGKVKSIDSGFFQINSRTAKWLHLWNPLNWRLNIIAGAGLLKAGYEIYGSEAGAACYFAHSGRCHAFR